MQELVRWWEAVHYTVLRRRCAEAGMHNLAAKQATSLLRYIGAVPADKAFYEAGEQHALSACLAKASRDQYVLFLCMLPELWLGCRVSIPHNQATADTIVCNSLERYCNA